MPTGALNEFEDNLVWRAADLLGVASRDRIDIRRRVAAGRQAIDERQVLDETGEAAG